MNNMYSTFSDLEERLHKLINRMDLAYSETEWADLIRKSLKENNLQGDEPVPAWLIDFVQCFIQGQEVDSTDFKSPDDNTNLERRWIEFIDSVIGGEWEYDGESESVALDSIGMHGHIDHEGSSYYFVKY